MVGVYEVSFVLWLFLMAKAPDWINKGTWHDNTTIYFVGVGEHEKLEVAREKAIAQARSLAASTMLSYVEYSFESKKEKRVLGNLKKYKDQLERELSLKSEAVLFEFMPVKFYYQKRKAGRKFIYVYYALCSMPYSLYKESVERLKRRVKLGEPAYWAEKTVLFFEKDLKDVKKVFVSQPVRSDFISPSVSGRVGREFAFYLKKYLEEHGFKVKLESQVSRSRVSGFAVRTVYSRADKDFFFEIRLVGPRKEKSPISVYSFTLSGLLYNGLDLPEYVELLPEQVRKFWAPDKGLEVNANLGSSFIRAKVGDVLVIDVIVPEDGYLFFFYISGDSVTTLPGYPRFVKEGLAKIPSPRDNFDLKLSPPTGVDLVKIVFLPATKFRKIREGKLGSVPVDGSLSSLAAFLKNVYSSGDYGEAALVVSVE